MATQRSSAVLLDGVKLPHGASPTAPPIVTYKELFFRFVLLGWIAFGGPTAHIALFQKVHSVPRNSSRPLRTCGRSCTLANPDDMPLDLAAQYSEQSAARPVLRIQAYWGDALKTNSIPWSPHTRTVGSCRCLWRSIAGSHPQSSWSCLPCHSASLGPHPRRSLSHLGWFRRASVAVC